MSSIVGQDKGSWGELSEVPLGALITGRKLQLPTSSGGVIGVPGSEALLGGLRAISWACHAARHSRTPSRGGGLPADRTMLDSSWSLRRTRDGGWGFAGADPLISLLQFPVPGW